MLKRAQRRIAASYLLSRMPVEAHLSRGRIYLYGPVGDHEGPWARITPITGSGDRFLLDAPRGDGWREEAQGSFARTFQLIAEDDLGTFHGLGAIEKKIKKLRPGTNPANLVVLKGKEFVHADNGSPCTAGEVLHWYFGLPLHVAREPVYWYKRHRKPSITEYDVKRKRILVRFEQYSFSGERFGGTCLYAHVNGSWGAYGVKPSESSSIRSAEAWLVKKQWCGWI